MRKRLLSLVVGSAMVLSLLAGCGSKPDGSTGTGVTGGASSNNDPIKLVVWGGEEDQTMLKEMVESFKAAHPDKTFDIQVGVESESTAKDTILKDIEAAADVFAFADDQLNELVKAGALQKVEESDKIK